MPTYKSDGSTIGNELLELNPFMYKGYFYDREIKMYYLKSRYYDPNLVRFINGDAEIGSVGETMCKTYMRTINVIQFHSQMKMEIGLVGRLKYVLV